VATQVGQVISARCRTNLRTICTSAPTIIAKTATLPHSQSWAAITSHALKPMNTRHASMRTPDSHHVPRP
jgi:hypothetical protein